MARKWMQRVRRRMERRGTVGALHRQLGIPEGKPIPSELIEEKLRALRRKSKAAGGRGLTVGERLLVRRLAFAKGARS